MNNEHVRSLLKLVLCGLLSLFCHGCEKKRILRVGIDLTSDNAFESKRDGTAKGVSVALSRAVAHELGCSIEIVECDFAEILGKVNTGTFDLAVSSIAVTQDRKALVNFSRPYARIPIGISTTAKFNFRQEKEPSDTVIAAKLGTTGVEYAQHYFPGAAVLLTTSSLQAVRFLHNGRADAFLYDIVSLHKLFLQEGLLFEPLDPWVVEEWAIAINPKDRKLQNRIDKALESLEVRGFFESVVAEHSRDNLGGVFRLPQKIHVGLDAKK